MTSRRILFLVSAHNSLSQRAWIELTERGHDVTVAGRRLERRDGGGGPRARPRADRVPDAQEDHPGLDLVPALCLVVHPGPLGDRGPSSLDWAVELDQPTWGVTVLQANDDVDAGDVGPRGTSLSALAARAACTGTRCAGRRSGPSSRRSASSPRRVGPAPLDPDDPRTIGRARPLMTQDVRAIDWHADATATVLRKLRAAEGHPGVLDEIGGTAFHLFGGHEEGALRGTPGQIIARRDGAICRATVDGAVWITTLKQAGEGAQAAGHARARAGRPGRERTRAPGAGARAGGRCGDLPRDRLRGGHRRGVGYLRFAFHNGAMSTEQCRRLQDAYAYARCRGARPRSSC